MEDYTVKISRTQKCGVLVAGGGVGGNGGYRKSICAES